MKAESQYLLLVMLGTIVFCQDTPNKLKFLETICFFRCRGVEGCMEDCPEMPPEYKYRDEESMANVTLLCRDVTSIILAHNFGSFLIDRRTSDNGNWNDVIRSSESQVELYNLAAGTRYQFRFHRVFEDEVSQPEITGWFDTMTESHKPSKVANFSVVSLQVEADEPMLLELVMRITPAEDRSCYYDGICTDSMGNRIKGFEPNTQDFYLTFTGLEFETAHTVSIRAITDRGISSDEAVVDFTTPLCLDMHRKMYLSLEVEGLNAATTRKGEHIFDVNVTWAMPKLCIPQLYYIWLYPNITDKEYVIRQNASGASTGFVFTNVKIMEKFEVRIVAQYLHESSGIISKNYPIREIAIITEVAGLGNSMNYLISTILVVVGIGIGIAVYGYFKVRRRRPHQVDEYEVSLKRLLTTRVLGTGAFGIVRLGSLQDDEGNLTNVAVKMLRDDSNENDLRNFLNEMKMMKALDKHPNIVSLLGCCTIGPYPFLIVEYCSRGDLHAFLRKSLVEAISLSGEAKNCIVISQELPQCNKILKNNSCDMSCTFHTNSDSDIVTVLDMLNFGRQIATGMEFLSSNRIVHRDLATRNVLVCHDRTVKISDFGLSRDVYQENFYKKSGNGRMPLKWMAIEALTHQLYSTHSDVWSFGILLWEIVTLGGDPYPGVLTIDLLKRLQSGYRLDRPENCSIPLYDVMLSCWKTKPRDRPTFTMLREELDNLISMTTENEYLDLNKVSEERLILP